MSSRLQAAGALRFTPRGGICRFSWPVCQVKLGIAGIARGAASQASFPQPTPARASATSLSARRQRPLVYPGSSRLFRERLPPCRVLPRSPSSFARCSPPCASTAETGTRGPTSTRATSGRRGASARASRSPAGALRRAWSWTSFPARSPSHGASGGPSRDGREAGAAVALAEQAIDALALGAGLLPEPPDGDGSPAP